MSIIKNIDLPTGGNVSYWKITKIIVEPQPINKAFVVLSGYINKSAKEQNKKPADQREFVWEGDDYPFAVEVLQQEGEDIYHLSYVKIKSAKRKVYNFVNNTTTELDSEFSGGKDD
mgnify:CR=1 FL=1